MTHSALLVILARKLFFACGAGMPLIKRRSGVADWGGVFARWKGRCFGNSH
jgi:hypothetical protein